MEIALFPCENTGTDICSVRNLSDLEHVSDVVLLSEAQNKLYAFPSFDQLCEYVLYAFYTFKV